MIILDLIADTSRRKFLNDFTIQDPPVSVLDLLDFITAKNVLIGFTNKMIQTESKNRDNGIINLYIAQILILNKDTIRGCIKNRAQQGFTALQSRCRLFHFCYIILHPPIAQQLAIFEDTNGIIEKTALMTMDIGFDGLDIFYLIIGLNELFGRFIINFGWWIAM